MPYTKTPTGDTYGTKIVNLFYPWDGRTTGVSTQDTEFKNLIAEPVGNGEYYQLIKRDGAESLTLSDGIRGSILGMYFWTGGDPTVARNYLVVISVAKPGDTYISVYELSTGARVLYTLLVAPVPLFAGNRQVTWTEFLYQNGSVDLLFTINNQLYILDDFPPVMLANPATTSATGIVKGVVFLDGYAFLANDAGLYNSNLNDPTTWPGSGFIAADSYPDAVLQVGRTGPYIVTTGKDSVQYFYDAGNPTGSPLAANVGATQHIGYSGGWAQNGDDIYFIGRANTTNPSLYKLTGLRIEEVSSFPLSRFWLRSAHLFDTASPTPNNVGAIVELAGHACYYVRTDAVPYTGGWLPPVDPQGLSLVYDLKSAQWSKIGYRSNEQLLLSCATQVPNVLGSVSMTYFGIYGEGDPNDILTVQPHRFNPDYYQDDGVNFECKFRTRPLDFGSYRLKFPSRVMLQADDATGTFATLSWSDDDYTTTQGFRQFNMTKQLKDMWAIGSAYRARSWTLTYTANTAMRFRALEIDYNLGNA